MFFARSTKGYDFVAINHILNSLYSREQTIFLLRRLHFFLYLESLGEAIKAAKNLTLCNKITLDTDELKRLN